MTDQNAVHNTIGAHWDKVTRDKALPDAKKRGISPRWVTSRFIHEWMNNRISGHPEPGPARGLNRVLKERLAGRVLGHGISIGAGTGAREIALVKDGLVERFTLYDYSIARIERGRKLAQEQGVGERVEFVQGDGLAAAGSRRFDIVHWHAALHHMFDVPEAVRWSRSALAPGGAFYMIEYVGPNRMQYSAEMLAWASAIRAMVPQRYLARDGLPPIRTTIPLPDAERIAANDPSESVDSARIMPAVAEVFPEATVWLLGGVGYNIALRHLIGNFDETRDEDREWLRAIMLIDDMLSARGMNTRAAALAFV